MEWDELPALFPGFEGPSRWLPLLRRHHELLAEAAAHTRVTAVAAEDAVQRHYAESLEILRIAAEELQHAPARAADVGSGGGFPGMVMACVWPDTFVALSEPLQKRARLLDAWAEQLGLANVEVSGQRAEEAGRGALRDACDLVTARAVTALPALLEYTAPLAAPGALLALPKGSGGATELEQAAAALRELACSEPRSVGMRSVISTTVSVIVVEKIAATPLKYPRRAGTPERKPL